MKNLKRLGLASCFVILSICFSIYEPIFPLSFDQVSARPFPASTQDAGFFSQVFHVPDAFDPDFEEMERKFKIFVYPHDTTACDKAKTFDGEYGNEGLFYLNLNQSRFLTKDPEKAHLFLIPIFCHSSPAGNKSDDERAIAVEDFVKGLISKYPYWSRTLGADHFFLTCKDINVTATPRVTNLLKNSIRVMCNPSYNDEYVPHKDVSLPQRVPPLALTPAEQNITHRKNLAFWRGLNNSSTRQQLLEFLGNDLELFIQEAREPSLEEEDLELEFFIQDTFNNAKFCICPGGPELDRTIALAIHFGCVPVIISDYYDLPFNDILDWKKFSVIFLENQVYYLKEFLEEITEDEYRALQSNTVMVQKHFQWNRRPVKYDAFHMTMYDLWLRNHFTKYY